MFNFDSRMSESVHRIQLTIWILKFLERLEKLGKIEIKSSVLRKNVRITGFSYSKLQNPTTVKFQLFQLDSHILYMSSLFLLTLI